MKTMTDKDNINAKLKLLNLKRDWSRCLELKGNLEVIKSGFVNRGRQHFESVVVFL